MSKSVTIAWWSAGITSTIACKLALDMYDDVELFYIETGSAHKDNDRFKKVCEEWYGRDIRTIRNPKYKDVSAVIRQDKYVNGPGGARCTLKLKKEVRYALQKEYEDNGVYVNGQVFGFEFSKKEVNRAIRFAEQNDVRPLFPLIERHLSKQKCANHLYAAGIKQPEMYKWFSNNNCIGCVKGGKGYWNVVREQFPDIFKERAEDERIAGHSCIKGVFLDELPKGVGRKSKPVLPNCGTFCEVEFGNIPHRSLSTIMNKETSIADLLKDIQQKFHTKP